MRKEVFAICDPDRDYTSGFTDYLIRRKAIPFDIRAFTGSDSLIQYASEKKVDLLLIHPDLLTREVKELPVATIVLLTDGYVPGNSGDYPCVNKFQACSEVIRKTLAFYTGSGASGFRNTAIKKSMDIVGVFSPVSRCGKTTFALALAQILGRTRPTLYLNFESFSGFDELMGTSGDSCLTDLLYFAGQKDGSTLLRRAAEIVQKAGRIDYIPPVKLPWDIRGASAPEILALLRVLSEESSYETLVLDIGNEVEDVLRVLEKCTRIIMPVCRDRISFAKIQQFESAVRGWGAGEVLNRIFQVNPPSGIPEGTGSAFLEQLESGSIGSYIHQFLRKHPLDASAPQ